jgi:hypothetical protein
MNEWIPLIQALVWPVFLVILLAWARKPLFKALTAIIRRIEEGAALTAR